MKQATMLKDKKIIIGITGSIAAYKTILLVRMLTLQGAEVRIVMTDAAKNFVSPLVLSTLSGHPVMSALFENDTWSDHVHLGRWADLMVIAPLTCNTLAKMAQGICDNLLLATYLSATCPVMIAPAMDEDMWKHPRTKQNVQQLAHDGIHIIPVNEGALASGLYGPGRMAEPEDLLLSITEHFKTDRFQNQKILITAGPTYEAIDPVRFIGNHSSGKMGIALAEQFYLSGAEVHLVLGPTTLRPKYKNIHTYPVTSAEEMYTQCTALFEQSAIAVLAAAVADFTPANVAEEKIKKGKEDHLQLTLHKTKDILKHLGSIKKADQYLVGFALETNNELSNAREKLLRKNADMIVLNSLKDTGAGFGKDTNVVNLLLKNGDIIPSGLMSKASIASFILTHIYQNIHHQNTL